MKVPGLFIATAVFAVMVLFYLTVFSGLVAVTFGL